MISVHRAPRKIAQSLLALPGDPMLSGLPRRRPSRAAAPSAEGAARSMRKRRYNMHVYDDRELAIRLIISMAGQ